MQTQGVLEGWSEPTTVYPEISKSLSSEEVLESRYVSDIQNNIKLMNCNIRLKNVS